MGDRKQTDPTFGKSGRIDAVIVSIRDTLEAPGALVGVVATLEIDTLISGQPLPENNPAMRLPHLLFAFFKRTY